MAASHKSASAARLLGRFSALRRVPVARLLAIGEIAILAREHLHKLEPHERRRVLELLQIAHGRPSRLAPAQRDELTALVQKAEPRLFAGSAAELFSPVPLPQRFVRGRRR